MLKRVAFFLLLFVIVPPVFASDIFVKGKRSKPGTRMAPKADIITTTSGRYSLDDLNRIFQRRDPFGRRPGHERRRKRSMGSTCR